ncbi:MAG: hypothetical protein ABS36_04145 [Acidobacteria bacterium SCN 69-37]|nr:MAG: hypothetical protein ABS36_04145 [Acidobacteria bacterium SCN 69-37]
MTDLARLEALCERHLATLDGDAAHDIDHVRRVVANARRLADAEGARLDVIVPAAWLHDCVVVAKDSPDRPRASRIAADAATRLLRGWGVAEARLPAIAHAIEAHSFSAGIPPQTHEAGVLRDADRLDAIGAIGIARCVMLGAQLGRPLYVAADPFCEHRDADDMASSIDHFYTKLLGLHTSFVTDAGRAEAARRTAVLRRYLDDLRHEIGWAGGRRES